MYQNTVLSSFAKQKLTPMQQISLQGIGLSIRIITHPFFFSSTSILAQKIFESGLNMLAGHLEIAHLYGLNVPIDPMIYKKHEDQESASLYPVSIAIEFLHLPLLVACRKHCSKVPFYQVLCNENQKIIPALTKYTLKHNRLLNLCVQNQNQILPYYLHQYAKLPEILKILLT